MSRAFEKVTLLGEVLWVCRHVLVLCDVSAQRGRHKYTLRYVSIYTGLSFVRGCFGQFAAHCECNIVYVLTLCEEGAQERAVLPYRRHPDWLDRLP